MNRKILMTVGIVGVLVLGGVATDANAACGTSKTFGQCYFSDGSCTSFVFPPNTNKVVNGGILAGRWWQAGARNLHNEGTGSGEPCAEQTWIETASSDGTGDAIRIYGNMNGVTYVDPCLGFGCPAGPLVATIETLSDDGSKAYYAAGKVAGTDEWNFAGPTGVNWVLQEIPRPTVTSSSRTGDTVTLNVQLPAPSGARGETGFPAETIVTGYQLMTAQFATDPGRNPNANGWANVGPVLLTTPAGSTGNGVQVQCAGSAPNDPDTWVATRLVYDNGQLSSVYVGEPRRIECAPSVADPRFNTPINKKPKSGRGDIRATPR